MQALDPAAEYWPAAHAAHKPSPAACVSLPAAQPVQALAPEPEYWPTAQLEQVLAPEREAVVAPAGQSVQALAPAAEYLPAAQLMQALALAAME